MVPNQNNSRIKIMAALVLVIIILIASASLQHRGQVPIKLLALPGDSVVKVDGKISRQGKIYLSKGVHELSASRQDFEDDTKNIDTSDIISGETIYLLPAAKSAAAKNWLLQHPEIQKQREAAGSLEAERTQRVLKKKYPIISQLPVENLHYKIDYSVGENSNLKLTITLFAIINRPSQHAEYLQQLKQYKTEALQYLKNNGLDPEGTEITYIPNVD